MQIARFFRNSSLRTTAGMSGCCSGTPNGWADQSL